MYNVGMDESRQFTLRYLFLELACIAAALASYRLLTPLLLDGHPAACPLAYLSAALTGMSVGGLFRRMRAGAVAGLVLLLPMLGMLTLLGAVVATVCGITGN
ncbi:MAG: hypothetical protein ACR2FY_05775 [Pirellulaceae bacterium]